MRAKAWLRALLAALVVVAPTVVWVTPAHAAVGLTPLADFTTPTTVGQVAPATFTITNNSDGAEAIGAVTVTDITLIPSCGNTIPGPGCTSPDLNVFQLNGPFMGTGSPGAICPSTYTVTLINAATGEVRFTPTAGSMILLVGQSCTINFTTTTLRVPTIDVLPATPGVQTAVRGSATGTAANMAPGGGFGTSFATVLQATPGIGTQATPQSVDIGEGFSDITTVTGAATGPTPTGTVTFELFGPTSPGFPTCTAAAFATTAAVPLTPTGPSTATAGSGTFGVAPPVPAGNYVFVASYSGDANYSPAVSACSDAAERVTVEAAPTITVDKTASPLTRPEPGGSFTFSVVVTNTSVEALTITSLIDDVYGNIATQGTCTTAIGTVLAASGGTYSCAFSGAFTGNPGASQTDIVTVVAQDVDGNTATDSDDATVSITDLAPTVNVDKTAAPLTRPEPGGSFTFGVVVTNTSTESVTITSLTDNVYGNIATQGTCITAVGTVLAASGTYSCAFAGAFNGNAGASQTDVVTVTVVDNEGTTGTDTDDATVSLTNVLPTVTVDKTAAPLTRTEPGGSFTFSVVITNTSVEPVTITALTDNIYGNIAAQGSCTTAVGTVLAASGTYSCAFTGPFTGNAGASQTDIVTVTVVDDDASTATDTDDATVSLTNVLPTVTVDKTAAPLTRPEPGGSFTFSVLVTNTSTESVTITALTDNIYGNIATQGSCTTAVGTVLAASGTYSCAFTGPFTGNAGATQTDIVTVTVVDDDASTATDTDDATVSLTNLPPTVQVDKTATPVSRLEPGGVFTFAVLVTNTSVEPVTITALTDNVYGNIATQGTCTTAVGTVLAAGTGTYSCSFSGSFAGNAASSQTDIVTVTVTDDEGTTGSDSDDATVTLVNALPTVVVDKTATPLTLLEPGGTFTFDVVVTNTSVESVTISTLTDDVHGNLAVQGTCTSAVGAVLAASGGSYNCSFDGDFLGNAGAAQTDTVTVVVTDDDGSTASDSDDATVTLGDILPTVDVDKTASPPTRPAPGGEFTFSVVVTNPGDEDIAITALNDDVYGDLLTQGTCVSALGTLLGPLESYGCSFPGDFTGLPGESQTDVVTVTATDDDDNSATASDDARVSLTEADTVGGVDPPPPPAPEPSPSPPPPLPTTGAALSRHLRTGVLLVLVGALLLALPGAASSARRTRGRHRGARWSLGGSGRRAIIAAT